jgi:AraC-like DNA-binding protein
MSSSNVLFVLIVFQLLFLCLFLFTRQKGKTISNWLLGFFFLAICLNLLDVLLLKTGIYFDHPGFAGFGSCLPLALLVFVIQLLMKALNRPFFFSFADEQDLPDRFLTLAKTNLSTTEKSEKEEIVQIVLQFMKSNKPYLEPELTLNQLASKLSLKPRMLSQAINEILQQNFFDFINRYRIEEAQRLLTNPKDKKTTVLEVLYQVGFNSKSSFNTLFKKYTGLTPTEFRNKQEQ